jgi:serine/threonine-protein kinase RsbW
MVNGTQISNNKVCATSDFTELHRIRQFVMDSAGRVGFSDDEASKIGLAVDEACTNIIKHSFKFDKSKKFCVQVETSTDFFIVNISDNGAPFDPLTVPDVDMKDYISNFKRGGLGIHIIRNVMDEVDYTPSAGSNSMNLLTLKKSLH